MYDGEKFYLEIPFDLPEKEERPAVTKLWAQARIRDLERSALSGRRADSMKDRIVKLAKEHGVSSRYTSFVVVEKRNGDRRANEQAETRVVPVNAPADWASFQSGRSRSYGGPGRGVRPAAGMPPPMPAGMPRADGGARTDDERAGAVTRGATAGDRTCTCTGEHYGGCAGDRGT